MLLNLSFNTFQKQNACLSCIQTHKLLYSCTNKQTHNPHPASPSLFPKGSRRNQPSNRGVLCKQAKGISTCGKNEQTRIQYQTGKSGKYCTVLGETYVQNRSEHEIYELCITIINMTSSPFPESHSCPPCPSPRPPQ